MSVERSVDMWSQFRQRLPFVPASKSFFDEILALSHHIGNRQDYSKINMKEPSSLPVVDCSHAEDIPVVKEDTNGMAL